MLATGIAVRLLIVFAMPVWSEDVWRFVWDGRLILADIHPFAHTPVYFYEKGEWPWGLHAALYEKLNSKLWYSVYPPACQGIFALAAWLFPHSDEGAVISIKLILWCCECGTLWLFWRNRQYLAVVLWALNPAVLLEICGNGHFEGALVCCMMWMFHAWQWQKYAWAGTSYALAFSVKLWPLLFLPAIAAWARGRSFLSFLTAYSVVCGLLFIPMFNEEIIANMGKSLDLYFQKFAFNGSIYYVLWEFGLHFLRQYSLDKLIGMLLLPFPLIAVACFSWLLWKKRSFPPSVQVLSRACLWIFTVYLLCASTVHPWYITFVLALSLWKDPFSLPSPSTRGHGQSHLPLLFPIVWTWTAFFSYSHYENGAFLEQKGWIAAEYLLVGLFLIRDIRAVRAATQSNP